MHFSTFLLLLSHLVRLLNNYLFADFEAEQSSEPEENKSRSLTKETIFDHIRRKSENFPAVSRTIQSESPVWKVDHLRENYPDFSTTASNIVNETNSDKFTADSMTISELEPGGTRKSLSSFTPKVSGDSNSDLSNIQMLSYDISMIKDKTRPAESKNSAEHARMQQFSPGGTKRQRCSLAMAGNKKEADPFMGFKSVFSFL